MSKIKPPISAQKLLLAFLKEELAEEVLGDLDEKFYSMLSDHSIAKAKRNYWFQVINYLRPFALKYIKTPQMNTLMVKHNFVIGYRILLRNKLFSLINIGGLAIGMTVVMLISFWIYDEFTFNKNHEHYDEIVQVLTKSTREGRVEVNSSLVSQVGVYLKDNYPNLFERVTVTFFRSGDQTLTFENEAYDQKGYFFLPDAPHIWSLTMRAGTRNGLEQVDGIMISETLAKKFFNGKNPIGERIGINGEVELTVTGVYKDLPTNSTFGDATFFASMELIYNDENPFTWTNFNTKVYAQLKPGITDSEASVAIKDVLINNRPEGSRPTELFLLPMKDWHWRGEFQDGKQGTSKRFQFVQLYGLIGLFVLVLACINFINLNTARFQHRGREVGVRKTIGSFRGPLIIQFLFESVLYAFAAFVSAILMCALFLPWFNDISDKTMVFPWASVEFWFIGVLFTLATALISGIYPAVFLSGFKPIKALKGTVAQGVASTRFRQGLVVFQFTISIMLIMGTITVFEQIQHAKNRPTGYEKDRIITVRGSSDAYYRSYDLLRSELKNTGVVVEMAEANYPLTNDLGNNDGFRLPGNEEYSEVTFNTIYVTPEYGTTTQWELVAGNDFSREQGDQRSSIIIGESAVEALGLTDPIGSQLIAKREFNGHTNFTIIGVVKDMVKASPFEPVTPLMVFSNTRSKGYLFVRIQPNVPYSEAIPAIERAFKKVLPDHPFTYQFLDEEYSAKFRAEEKIGSLATFFTVLAILISCLGLFGLSAFMAEKRTKEVGIRKVMGASVVQLWQLLSKDFGLLVIIASFIALPVAHYFLENWLQSYEYRTYISWQMYVISAVGCFIVTFITVSYHSLKASLANPVNALRAE